MTQQSQIQPLITATLYGNIKNKTIRDRNIYWEPFSALLQRPLKVGAMPIGL